MKEEISKLANCNPTNKQKIISREVFNNAKKLFDIRSNIIKAFENGIFPPQKICIKNRLETIPDWIKVGNHTFERIRERANNYVKKGWHSKVNKKSITMNPVKMFLYKI